MNKKINKRVFIVLIFLLSIGVFGLINHSQAAGTLTSITATPFDVTAGSTVNYNISFTTATTIANTGKIVIQFPTGFDISSATSTSWTGFDGARNMSISGQTITITRTSGTSSTAGAKTIILSNIVNSTTTANNYQVTVTTKNSSNTVLDGPNSTIYFQIFSANTPTTVDGLYYLRGTAQTHYQNNNSLYTHFDLGTFSRVAPTSDEERHCSDFLQFYFDENGTYTSTTTISNIYYHTWWTTANNQGTLGYYTAGAYGITTIENFTINSTNSPNKVGGDYLYAGQQTFATSQSVFGNAMYNFGVTLLKDNQYPQIISSPTQPSFIILNLPASSSIATLGISQDGDTDYDNDELTDYDELFTYYTNPYDSDTDDDSWNDKYEIDNSLNPNDPDSAPTFEYFKQFNGAAVSDSFGTSVASISDIDGDGKDDILVGAPSAAPNGLSGAGSAYLYSSNDGSLIKQYNGGAANDAFGNSVASTSDIDGDGLDDVLVGASGVDPNGLSGAGSVYLYSSGTGNLIKQFNGDSTTVNGFFGNSIASIGDIDGDGLDDVLVGARGASPEGIYSAGSVYIYSSGTGNLIRQYNGSGVLAMLGMSISSISDIDGDGLDDVLAGAILDNSYTGSAYIYSSGTGNLIRRYNGKAVNDTFGVSIASISDMDGDGLEDVLVGATYVDLGAEYNIGSAYLYSSGTGNLIRQYNGIEKNDKLGQAISSISDIDGDGLDDILVTSIYAHPISYKTSSGSVYLYSSGTGNLIKQFNGEMANDNFGYSVVSISDIDGDDKDDVLVGAYNADPNGLSNAGSVYLYYSSEALPTQTWSKNTTKSTLDLDDYFKDSNNSTVPARSQTVTYTASTSDNPNIDVTINSSNVATFSQPTNWLGTETVRFTALDSTGLSSTSTLVTLMVTGAPNTPSSLSLTVDSETQVNTSWSTNLNLSTTTYYIENTTAGTNSGWISDTSWTSTGLSCGTVYSFRVKAKDGNGLISDFSSPSTITTRGCVGGGAISCPKVPDGSTISIKDTSTLNLSTVSGVVNMAISNTPDFTNVGIEPFQSIKSWTFTSDKVYAKFYNSCGESSPIVSASRQSVPTLTSTPTPTPTDPQSILNSLLQQLTSLQQQLANQQTKYIFTKGIQYGDTGEDVTQLQTFLKNQGIDIYPEGLITGYFGNLTKLAVQRFQLKYNIAQSGDPGYGYVGPKTREKINSL
jgi:hypothetical protein